MKQFTVKDFILYNNPCFSCGERIILDVVATHLVQVNPAVLRPLVTPDLITIPLKVTYGQTLQLKIQTQTNKLEFEDNKAMADYIYSHRLNFTSRCNKCYTTIDSQFLEFDLLRKIVKPVGISYENLVVNDATHTYHIYTSYMAEESVINMDRMDKPGLATVKLQAPLMPLSRFKDREHLIKKMRTYLIFT